MTIEESDFKLIEENGRFDLYLIKTINAKNADKKREELALIGHDMQLENCIKRIVFYRLNKKQDVYNLKSFLKEYKQEFKELKDFLNGTI